ncbi:MAG: hypothetical protein HY286_17310 [Planctomycetes bacterium]|nr:hypothetical protein [Planctomycetota bacterium]
MPPIVSVMILSLAARVPAQAPRPEPDRVLERLGRIEAENARIVDENKHLRERVDALERQHSSETLQLPEIEFPKPPQDSISTQYRDVIVQFRAFGDVGAKFMQTPRPGNGNNNFGMGGLDLFITAQLGDHFQILSETAIDADPIDDVGLDQERFYAKWTADDWLYIKLGVEHSPLSWFNRTFHHGKWLYLSTDRPFSARFEDNGGILPAHFSGVEIGGEKQFGFGNLEYAAVVSNGRGTDPTIRQRDGDINDSKAFTLSASLRPEALRELEFGAGAYTDVIPENTTNPAMPKPMREHIVSAHANIRSGPWELLSEAVWVEHEDRAMNRNHQNQSAYLQASYRIDSWTPYLRLDLLEMEHNDPFFKQLNEDLDQRQVVFGVRHEVHANAAIKLEGVVGSEERRNAIGSISDHNYFGFAFQFAWTF